MDPEDRKLLQETIELVRENNQMLHKVRRVQKRTTLWSIFKITIVVGIALGSFYFLQPYVDRLVEIYKSVFSLEQQLKDSSMFQSKPR